MAVPACNPGVRVMGCWPRSPFFRPDRLTDFTVLPSSPDLRLPTRNYRPRSTTPFATSAHRAAAMTPMKRRTSSNVSHTSRPRRSSGGAPRSPRPVPAQQVPLQAQAPIQAEVRNQAWARVLRHGKRRGSRVRTRAGGRRGGSIRIGPVQPGGWHAALDGYQQSRLDGGFVRTACRPLPPHREIAQPLREIVVAEKGAGIGARTERGQVRDRLGSNLRTQVGDRRELDGGGRRLPQPGGHGRARSRHRAMAAAAAAPPRRPTHRSRPAECRRAHRACGWCRSRRHSLGTRSRTALRERSGETPLPSAEYSRRSWR